MAISFVASGAWAAGSTSIAAVRPAGVLAGDMQLLFCHNKSYQAIPTDPSGWTFLHVFWEDAIAPGAADTGSVRTTVWYREATANGETTPASTVAITSNNVGLACVRVFRKASTATWQVMTSNQNGVAGGVTAASLNWSAALNGGGSSIWTAPIVGDFFVVSAGVRSDAGTQSGIGVTMSPFTGSVGLSAFTESPATDGTTTTGLDLAASGGYFSVTSASEDLSVNVITYTATLAASHTGSIVGVGLREIPAAIISNNRVMMMGIGT